MLVMFGEADLLVPPEMARMYTDHAPACESVVIPDAGHAVSSDQPEAYADAILEFAANQTV